MKKKLVRQLNFRGVKGWGGKRFGAGRPNLSKQVNHMRRPEVKIKTPLHITLRLKERLPSIRNKKILIVFKDCIRRARPHGLYIIHFSLQSNHIHLFCESEDNTALALGMRALTVGFAKTIRRFAFLKGAKKKGSVFKGRYHLHVLKTPRETRNAVEYVLLNKSKHQKLIEHIDEYSSGAFFRNWRLLLGRRFRDLIKHDVEFLDQQHYFRKNTFLSSPQSWLANTGWKRACG